MVLDVAEKAFEVASKDKFWSTKKPVSIVKNINEFLNIYKQERKSERSRPPVRKEIPTYSSEVEDKIDEAMKKYDL
jgi:hypothetical protein